MDSQEIDRLCDEFERRLSSHFDVGIEDFIGESDLDVPDELIVKLLRIEKKLVGSTNPPRSLASYDDLLCDFAETAGDGATHNIRCDLEAVTKAKDRLALRVALLRIKHSCNPTGELESTLVPVVQRGDESEATRSDIGVAEKDTGDDSQLNTTESADASKASRAIGWPDSLRIPDRYRAIRELGKGGFGRVVLAHDTVLRRNVALKLPRPEAFSSQDARSAFLKEARTSAQMHHPGLVTVYDVDTSDGMLCIVQEFIDGCDLCARIRHDSLSREDVLRLMVEVSEAVHYAHEAGFIHRDLKPSNILVDREGQPHVADFGLALLSSDAKTRSLGFAGTPAYMSPEQMERVALDPRSDIWSLGVILYELLMGFRPFHAETSADLMNRVLNDKPIRPSSLDPRIPNTLDEICLKCLERFPERRFSSAADLARSLRFALDPRHRLEEVPELEDDQNTLEQRVLLHVNAARFSDCKVRTIASALGLHSQDEKKHLRTIIQSLANRSLLQYGNDRIVRAIGPCELQGRLTNLRSGCWCLALTEPVDEEFAQRVMIDCDQAGNAKQGDHVRIRLDKAGDVLSKGKVIEVIRESSPRALGRMEVAAGEAYAIVENDDRIYLGPAQQVAALHGESVYVDRLAGSNEVSAVVAEVLAENEDREDIEILTKDLNLPRPYSAGPTVAEQILFRADQAATSKNRLDLRDCPTYSIAERGRGDLSNAFSIARLHTGHWLLGVHVTDVASHIQADSDLDREAARRGASVFLGRIEIPMLPPVLSHHWLALRPAADRLCKTVWLEFASGGELIKTEICRSIIRSEHLSCDVGDTLLASADMKETEGVESFLAQAVALASLIRNRRHIHGQFELYRPALNIGLMQARTASVKKSGRSISSQIASEFCLAANKAVAAFLAARGHPFVRRIQPPPGKKRLEQAYRIFRARGIACGNLRSLRDLQELVERFTGTPDEQIVLQVIRRTVFFAKASYCVENRGHFGLGVDDYCHFNDPLRRYADITVHRAVDAALAHDLPPMNIAELSQIAKFCVDADARAAIASRRFAKRDKLRALRTWKLTRPFDAVVEQVTSAGLRVRNQQPRHCTDSNRNAGGPADSIAETRRFAMTPERSSQILAKSLR